MDVGYGMRMLDAGYEMIAIDPVLSIPYLDQRGKNEPGVLVRKTGGYFAETVPKAPSRFTFHGLQTLERLPTR